jgi:hypothetical protein
MGEFDFLEPIPKTVVTVKLPSRGVPYPEGAPQATGKLTLSAMTMVEESLFANFRGDNSEVIDKVLQRCIQESLDVNTLLSADKFFLFMMLRAVTYGSEYTFNWNCPNLVSLREVCGHKNTTSVMIPDDFKVKYLSDEDTEPFKLTLPESQKEISFRLLRGMDEVQIDRHVTEQRARQKAGVGGPDTSTAFRMARQIVAVDGKSVKEAPEQKLMAFILSLPSRDVQALRDKIGFYTPGINTDVTLVCADCGAAHEWDLPFTADFFRAKLSDAGSAVVDEIRSDVLPGDEL